MESLAWSEVSINFHLAKQISLLELKTIKSRNIQSFRLKPEISLSPLQLNETRCEKILQLADFANRKTCSFIRLNDAFRKTFPQGSQKNSKTTHFESRGQSNTRADFKLTHRENYGRYEKCFFFLRGGGGDGRGGEGGGQVNGQREFHDNLSLQRMYSGNIR